MLDPELQSTKQRRRRVSDLASSIGQIGRAAGTLLAVGGAIAGIALMRNPRAFAAVVDSIPYAGQYLAKAGEYGAMIGANMTSYIGSAGMRLQEAHLVEMIAEKQSSGAIWNKFNDALAAAVEDAQFNLSRAKSPTMSWLDFTSRGNEMIKSTLTSESVNITPQQAKEMLLHETITGTYAQDTRGLGPFADVISIAFTGKRLNRSTSAVQLGELMAYGYHHDPKLLEGIIDRSRAGVLQFGGDTISGLERERVRSLLKLKPIADEFFAGVRGQVDEPLTSDIVGRLRGTITGPIGRRDQLLDEDGVINSILHLQPDKLIQASRDRRGIIYGVSDSRRIAHLIQQGVQWVHKSFQIPFIGINPMGIILPNGPIANEAAIARFTSFDAMPSVVKASMDRGAMPKNGMLFFDNAAFSVDANFQLTRVDNWRTNQVLRWVKIARYQEMERTLGADPGSGARDQNYNLLSKMFYKSIEGTTFEKTINSVRELFDINQTNPSKLELGASWATKGVYDPENLYPPTMFGHLRKMMDDPEIGPLKTLGYLFSGEIDQGALLKETYNWILASTHGSPKSPVLNKSVGELLVRMKTSGPLTEIGGRLASGKSTFDKPTIRTIVEEFHKGGDPFITRLEESLGTTDKDAVRELRQVMTMVKDHGLDYLEREYSMGVAAPSWFPGVRDQRLSFLDRAGMAIQRAALGTADMTLALESGVNIAPTDLFRMQNMVLLNKMEPLMELGRTIGYRGDRGPMAAMFVGPGQPMTKEVLAEYINNPESKYLFRDIQEGVERIASKSKWLGMDTNYGTTNTMSWSEQWGTGVFRATDNTVQYSPSSDTTAVAETIWDPSHFMRARKGSSRAGDTLISRINRKLIEASDADAIGDKFYNFMQEEWGTFKQGIEEMDWAGIRGYFNQFFPSVPQDITSAAIGPYSLTSILGHMLDPVGLGFGEHTYAGGAKRIGAGLLFGRFLPIAGMVRAYNWLDREAEAITGDQGLDDTISEQIAGSRLAMARARDMLGATYMTKAMYNTFPGMEFIGKDLLGTIPGIGDIGLNLGTNESYEELQDYYNEGLHPIRSGRWWMASKTPWRGGRILGYEPSWYAKEEHDVLREPQLQRQERLHSFIPSVTPGPGFNPLSTFWGAMDPHWKEKYYYEDRPYPMTGPLMNETTPGSSIINPTIGAILKPQLRMHRDEVDRSTRMIRDIQGGAGAVSEANADAIRNAIESGSYDVDAEGMTGGYGGTAGELSRYHIGAINKATALYAGQGSRGSPGGISGGLDIPGYHEASALEIPLGNESISSYMSPMWSSNNPLYQAGLAEYQLTELAGLRGFAFASIFGDWGTDTPVAESFDVGSLESSWWKANIGSGPIPSDAMQETTELLRRFWPHERQASSQYNPITNTQPSWMPDSATYFRDFQHGDPYTGKTHLEGIIPGEGFENLWSDVLGDKMYIQPRASMIGYDKSKMVEYLSGVEPPVGTPEKSDYYTDLGDEIHRTIQRNLYQEGVLLGAEVPIKDPASGITGHIDAIIRNGESSNILEIKSLSPQRMSDLPSSGYPEHISQLNFYLHATQQQRGFLYYVNQKNKGDTRVVPVNYDRGMAIEDITRFKSAQNEVNQMTDSGLISPYQNYSSIARAMSLAISAPWSDEYAMAYEAASEEASNNPEQMALLQRFNSMATAMQEKHTSTPYKYVGVPDPPEANWLQQGLGYAWESLSHLDTPLHCISPNTQIITDNGVLEASALKSGDMVLTHTGTFKKVIRVEEQPYGKRIVDIKIKSSTIPLTVTEDHPILACRGVRKNRNTHQDTTENHPTGYVYEPYGECPTIEFIKAGDLKEYDFVVYKPRIMKNANQNTIVDLSLLNRDRFIVYQNKLYPLVPQSKTPKPWLCRNSIPAQLEIDGDIARFIGYYISEGCIGGRKNQPREIIFAFHLKEIDYANDIVSIIQSHFDNISVNVKYQTNINAIRVVFTSPVLAEFLTQYIGTKFNKKVPDSLLTTNETRAEFVRGLMRGDGLKYGKCRYTEIEMCLPNVIVWLRDAIFNLWGMSSSVSRRIRDKCTDTYRLLIGQYKHFADFIDSYNKYEHIIFKHPRQSRIKCSVGEYIFYRVQSIEISAYQGETIDVEVEDDDTFSTIHADVHNTKFLPVRSSLEQYERSTLYGDAFGNWQTPIKSWVKPSLQSVASKNPVYATLFGAGIGSLFGSTREGRFAGAVIGGATGAGVSIPRSAYEMISGRQWVPSKIDRIRDVEKYFSMIEYVKWRTIHESTGNRQAKEKMKNTWYGVMPHSPYATRAVPYNERQYIRQLAGERNPRNQEHILQMVSEPAMRILQARWGREVDNPSETPEEYFQDHYLPPEDWAGWNANEDIDDYKADYVDFQGLDIHDFGIWPEDIKRARVRHIKFRVNINRPGGEIGEVDQAIRHTLRANGMILYPQSTSNAAGQNTVHLNIRKNVSKKAAERVANGDVEIE